MNIEIVRLIKENAKYENKSKTTVGIIITATVAIVAFLAIICFAFAQISQNAVFGIIIGAAVVFYAVSEAYVRYKNRILKNMQSKKEKYFHKLKSTHLNELSQDEFTELAFRSIRKRMPEINFVRNGIFYRYGDIGVVFLMLPRQKKISCEKINMALSVGAKQIIVVCTDSDKADIQKRFCDKIKFIVTDSDIINDSPELGYEEPKAHTHVALRQMCNTKNAFKLLKLSALCVLMSFISIFKLYFTIFAVLFGIVGISFYAIELKKKFVR